MFFSRFPVTKDLFSQIPKDAAKRSPMQYSFLKKAVEEGQDLVDHSGGMDLKKEMEEQKADIKSKRTPLKEKLKKETKTHMYTAKRTTSPESIMKDVVRLKREITDGIQMMNLAMVCQQHK